MSHIRNLLSLIRCNKGMSIVVILVCVLAAGVLVTFIYHAVEKPQKILSRGDPAGRLYNLDELVRQLDKAIDSLKKKTDIKSLKFVVTKEAEAQEGSDKVVLDGVLWSGKDSLAIINKKIVGLGDRVSDCWVTEIQEGKVNLRCRDTGEKVLLRD